jgi:hypothetical protein
MKLSFLIQMMLLLLLVVGVYLLFSNSIEGKNKLILIIFCLVLGVYLFMKLPMFKDNNEILDSPQSARRGYTLNPKTLKKTDGPIGLSCWIYIDNWNYRHGKEKKIISSKNDYFPEITLDAFKNDLKINVNVYRDYDYTPQELKDELIMNEVQLSDNPELVCKNGTIHTKNSSDEATATSSWNAGNGTTAEDAAAPAASPSSDLGVKCPPIGKRREVIIENINIQKWVNIIVTFNNRTLDTYINGKLVKSKPFDNIIINQGGKYTEDINITPDDGFGGFISKVQYYPFFITPAKAWSIYKGGFGDAFASALNKYNLSVSFYEDQIEKKKYYVF